MKNSIQFCPQKHDTFIVGRASNGGCKTCCNDRIRDWQRRHRDTMLRTNRRWYAVHGIEYRHMKEKENPLKSLASRRKQDWKGIVNSAGEQITSRDYDTAYALQGRRCANMFCGRGGKLHMDHDHITMVFRGLLCGPCNRALGMCRDNTDCLVGLAAYVKSGLDISTNRGYTKL